MGDWKKQRREELEELREKYESAKKLVDSPDWQRAQNGFMSELFEVVESWNGTRNDAFRVASVCKFITTKLREPVDTIEEYERRLKNINQMDPDAN